MAPLTLLASSLSSHVMVAASCSAVATDGAMDRQSTSQIAPGPLPRFITRADGAGSADGAS